MIVKIVTRIESAIVLFYDQRCDCECNNRKEIMLKMVNIFTMANRLQEYSCDHNPTLFSITFCGDIHNIKYNYLQS